MPDPLFETIAEEMQADPRVHRRKLFGHAGLMVGRKLFACDIDGELLVKLPLERCDEMISAGARKFMPGGSERWMTGWVVVPAGEGDPVRGWIELTDEAKLHVAED